MKTKIKDKWDVRRESAAHRRLGREAATVAGRVLAIFEREHPEDKRPREAIVALRAWARGTRKLGMAEVRKLSLEAHAAARGARTAAARFAARAAGQAVATWHVPRHAYGAKYYGDKAKEAVKKAKKLTS